jgi:hypothetical protein
MEGQGDGGPSTGGGSSSPSPPPVSPASASPMPGTVSSSPLLSPSVEEPFSRDVGCYTPLASPAQASLPSTTSTSARSS